MKLRIGTRKSTLALWQAHQVKDHLHRMDIDSELVEIESFGDSVQDIPIHKLGDKGVFTKALDDALLQREIDLAVHSLKDVPTLLPEGLALKAVLQRGNPMDVLVKPDAPAAAKETRTIATGSIRRTAFWLNRYPEDEVVGLRGNVPTRLQKVDNSDWHGAIFAYAGLERIGYDDRISEVLDWMIPAPSQGAVGIVAREDSEHTSVFEALNDHNTRICVDIERAFLRELEAGCSSPVGAHAVVEGSSLHFKGAVLSLDGSARLDIQKEVEADEATAKHGTDWARELKQQGALELLSEGSGDE